MTRPTLVRAVLWLIAVLSTTETASAQTLYLADSTPLRVVAPAPTMMNAFPQPWRDSVVAGWAREFTGGSYRPASRIPSGVEAVVKLRILRNGDLHRATLSRRTGDAALDSILLATSVEADRALRYPKFPVGVEGAGTDIELVVTVGARGTSTRAIAATVSSRVSGFEPPPLTAECDSVVAEPNSRTTMTLRLELDQGPGNTTRADWAARVLTSFQSEFRAPGLLTPAIRPKVWMEGDPRQPIRITLPGVLHLVTDSIGKAREAGMLVSTGFPALDSALVAMVWTASENGAIPPPPIGDTAFTIDAAIVTDRGESHVGTPLGVVSLASWIVEEPPRIVRPGMPRYPEEAKRAGIRGRVALEFIVGTDGRPIPASIAAITTPHQLLTDAAAETILSTRFSSGLMRGCAVPTRVRQNVNFQ